MFICCLHRKASEVVTAPTPNKKPAKAVALANAIEASTQSAKRAAAADKLKAVAAAATNAKKTGGDQILELSQANPGKTVTPSPTSSKVVTVTRKGPGGEKVTKTVPKTPKATTAAAPTVIDLTQSSNITTERGNARRPKVAVIEAKVSAKAKATK